MNIKVEVTQEDINCGVRQDSEKCPIARALNRQFQTPEVDGDVTFFLNNRQFYGYLPKEAKTFIGNFDHIGSEAVQPFSFEFDATEKEYDLD